MTYEMVIKGNVIWKKIVSLKNLTDSVINTLSNVLKIGSVTESKKLSIHGSLVGPTVEPMT